MPKQNTKQYFGICECKSNESKCTLEKVSASVQITGDLAYVKLKQYYANTLKSNIEAVYRFPIPFDASVMGFTAQINDKIVTGEIMRKDKAEIEYKNAIKRGDSAALLNHKDKDIFEIAIGNLQPKDDCIITIEYLQTIQSSDDEYRFLIPTVLAPRYSPKKRPISEEEHICFADVSHTLSFRAEFQGPGSIDNISCPSHVVNIECINGNPIVTFDQDALLDSDVILKFENRNIDNTLALSTSKNGNFGYFRLIPEEDYVPENFEGKEYIFVLDASGSMSGEKMRQAKRAISLCLRSLVCGDKFEIIAFGSGYKPFFNKCIPYDQNSLDEADKKLNAVGDMGGTEILRPLEHIFRTKPLTQRRIVMLFTDGQIGNEKEVINLVEKNQKGLQLYSFGIDTAVNQVFIDSIAKAGNGIPEYIYPGEEIESKVIRQFARIGMPKITDITCHTITKGTSTTLTTEYVPAMPKFMFPGETYSAAIKFDNVELPEKFIIDAFLNGSHRTYEYTISPVQDANVLEKRWAQQYIGLLETKKEKGTHKKIITCSERYGVLSTLTSYIAVIKKENPATGIIERINIPSALPSSWEFDSMGVALGGLIAHSLCNSTTAFSSQKDRSNLLSFNKISCINNFNDSDGFIQNDSVIRSSLLLQRANGSVNDDPVKTSKLIIGIILSGEYSLYRKQLSKAVTFIKASAAGCLCRYAALYLAMKKGICSLDEIFGDSANQQIVYIKTIIDRNDTQSLATLLGMSQPEDDISLAHGLLYDLINSK